MHSKPTPVRQAPVSALVCFGHFGGRRVRGEYSLRQRRRSARWHTLERGDEIHLLANLIARVILHLVCGSRLDGCRVASAFCDRAPHLQADQRKADCKKDDSEKCKEYRMNVEVRQRQ